MTLGCITLDDVEKAMKLDYAEWDGRPKEPSLPPAPQEPYKACDGRFECDYDECVECVDNFYSDWDYHEETE